MKEIISDFIKIIEESNGDETIVENQLTSYMENNKEKIDSARKIFEDKMAFAMQNIDKADFQASMQKMFETIVEVMGEENFKKMNELQQKYPFIKNVTQKFMPK